MANIKLGDDTITGVESIKVKNADDESQYVTFGTGTSGLVLKNDNTLPPVPASPVSDLTDYTWGQINSIALSGNAAQYFALGATKSMILTGAVLGTTTHTVQIIGINVDNANSITFDTVIPLSNSITFGEDSNWTTSNVKAQCENYYNYMPCKEYVLPINKGTYYTATTSTAYANENVFALSRFEISGTGNAGEATYGVQIKYPFYTDNESRRKSNLAYWLRSPDASNSAYGVQGGYCENAYYVTTSFRIAPAFVIGNNSSVNYWLEQNGVNENANVKKALSVPSISTATGILRLSDWSNNTQTINVTGVTADNTVIVSPAPNSVIAYTNAGVYCSAQGDGTLTFTYQTTPISNITINTIIL